MNKADELKKKLVLVQAMGGVAWSALRKSNFDMYEHIAEIFFWWLEASKQKGYLDAEYAKIGEGFRKTKHLINFIPLFWLVWGTTNCNKDIASRHSKAMNKIYEEYIGRKRYYSKDRVYKLAKFIEQNNGINGLCDYKKEQLDTDDAFYAEEEQLNKQSYSKALKAHLHKSVLTENEEDVVVYEEAKQYYSTQPNPPTINISFPVATSEDDLTVALIKRTSKGYEILGTTNDKFLVKAVAIANFKNNTNVLPNSIKSILEGIKTQTLPASLIKFRNDLTDSTGNKHKSKKYKRLIYRVSQNNFLLSPVRSRVGVVTVVTPINQNFYTGNGDIYLSTLSLKQLERKLIANKAINTYKIISEHNNEFSVEKLFKFQNNFNYNDFLFADFWKFTQHEMQLLNQANISISALDKVNWEQVIDGDFFKKLDATVVDKWFETHGKLIKRDKGAICKLTFEQTKLVIEFVYVNELFEVKLEVAFKTTANSKAKNILLFRTKDIMPVLKAVAELNADNVTTKLNNNILQFEFTNTTATYQINIPTLTTAGKLNDKAFEYYTATIGESDDIEFDDFEYEKDSVID